MAYHFLTTDPELIRAVASKRIRIPRRLAYAPGVMETTHRSLSHGVHLPEDTLRLAIGPELGAELCEARLRRGPGLRATARRIGISHGYLKLLEHGVRAPSGRVARAILDVIHLDPWAAEKLLAFADKVDEGRARRERERAMRRGTPPPNPGDE